MLLQSTPRHLTDNEVMWGHPTLESGQWNSQLSVTVEKSGTLDSGNLTITITVSGEG